MLILTDLPLGKFPSQACLERSCRPIKRQTASDQSESGCSRQWYIASLMGRAIPKGRVSKSLKVKPWSETKEEMFFSYICHFPNHPLTS